MKIVSWNINGIRACYKKGLQLFLTQEDPDIVCFQEIKAQANQFPNELLTQYPYHTIFPAEKKGYSGVAIFSKHKPINITFGIDDKIYDVEGRVLIVEFKSFLLFNCYFPNGQRDHARVPYKLQFSDAVVKKISKLTKKHHKPAIICGDFNTAHQEIDLANPKANSKTTGFLPIERTWLDQFMNKGFVDTFRFLHPTLTGQYTWWTYRGDCRERNIGWRIDYFFVSKNFISKILKSYHLPHVSGSDHCPIVLEIKS